MTTDRTGAPRAPETRGDAEAQRAPVVLVVDDSRLQRRILSVSLRKWGFEVLEADSGQAGLDIARATPIDVILSDWMMPGMSGPEFCRAYRALPGENYAYFILLTSKTEKGAVTEGLDTGADDFLNKPVDVAELRSRIKAGQRILAMQQELAEKNETMKATLDELRALHKAINRDLEQACILQKALMPPRYLDEGAYSVTTLVRPSGHVGGDLVGYQVLEDGRICFWSVDVSGHGIASALITIRLSSLFKASSGGRNLLFGTGEDGETVIRRPSAVFNDLNTILCSELETDHYLTMMLGTFDPADGALTFSQAGHPNPVLQRVCGRIEFLGHGGMPIGLIGGSEYEDETVTLSPGDRLFVYSDGVTECENPDGAMVEDAGLAAMMGRHAGAKDNDFMEKLMWELAEFADGRPFGDDISAVLLDFAGKP